MTTPPLSSEPSSGATGSPATLHASASPPSPQRANEEPPPPPPPSSQPANAAAHHHGGLHNAALHSKKSAISLADKLAQMIANHERFVSFEYFPPKTAEGTMNLLRRVDDMSSLGPLFVDVTSSPKNRAQALDICEEILLYCGADAMLHLTCASTTRAEMLEVLLDAKRRGIRNVMALHGETVGGNSLTPPATPSNGETGFRYASELVSFIREEFGNYFTVAVACYPEGLNGKQMEECLEYLLAKQEAGADFCITQLFFDPRKYFDFVGEARHRGVRIPILPGLMPIQAYKVFQRTTAYLHTAVPERVLDALQPIKENDESVRRFGVELAVELSSVLLAGGAPGVHFFTLNLERTVTLAVQELRKRGLIGSPFAAQTLGRSAFIPTPAPTPIPPPPASASSVVLEGGGEETGAAAANVVTSPPVPSRSSSTSGVLVAHPPPSSPSSANGAAVLATAAACKPLLPWKQSAHSKRAGEEVRPIFWSNKPRSYIERTKDWDEFPNGRWGDASSPAFGELKGSHYYQPSFGSRERRLRSWGTPLSLAEVGEVFVSFLQGEVESLPWSESGLALETGAIRDALVELNRAGFFTINSQPKVNGLPSSHPQYGWGPPGGYVYQKSYLEFFVCEAGARAIAAEIDAHPEVYGTLAYHCVNARGDVLRNRAHTREPTAVTWGVFPSKEVVQPTVVDPEAFLSWRDEAFQLWTAAWADVYPEGSPSHSLLWDVHDSFWLVNLVDDDYMDSGDIFRIFRVEAVRAAAGERLHAKRSF